MTREEWLKDRMTGIGGSDAPAALGLSQWKTPYALWQEKRGEGIEIEDSESMLWGRALEPVIRQQYAERTGRTVRLPDGIIRHPQIDFMLANVDGVTDDQRVLEIKTARTSQDWGEPGTDEIPQVYLVQVQHYLAVTGFAVADVATLIGGSDFRLYEVPADAELQEMIIEGEREFWRRVQDNEPPEPVSYADVQARFGRSSTAAAVEADTDLRDYVRSLHAIKQQMAALKEHEEDFKTRIMLALGEADTLTFSGLTLATWKAAKAAERFDSKAFRAAHPDIYQQFLKTGEVSRRFLLKG